jgi:hypothetical protein
MNKDAQDFWTSTLQVVSQLNTAVFPKKAINSR